MPTFIVLQLAPFIFYKSWINAIWLSQFCYCAFYKFVSHPLWHFFPFSANDLIIHSEKKKKGSSMEIFLDSVIVNSESLYKILIFLEPPFQCCSPISQSYLQLSFLLLIYCEKKLLSFIPPVNCSSKTLYCDFV